VPFSSHRVWPRLLRSASEGNFRTQVFRCTFEDLVIGYGFLEPAMLKRVEALASSISSCARSRYSPKESLSPPSHCSSPTAVSIKPCRPYYRASNCTILSRLASAPSIAKDRTSPCCQRITHLFVLSLYSTRCPHSLHRIASPLPSETLLLHSPQMYRTCGPAASAAP